MTQSAAPIEGTVHVKPGRGKKILGRYPWVQREEVLRASEGLSAGSLVRLFEGERFLALGTYDPKSRFTVRALSLRDEPIGQAFFEQAIRSAQALRDPASWQTNAYRALFSEADSLPGLIVDRYADYLAVQVRSMGMERLKSYWLPALVDLFQPKGVYERSDMAGRKEESLEPFAGPLWGETPERVMIEERGLTYSVPITGGLKTGHYLDQRENRRRLEEAVRPGERVLDLFCYTGGFSMAAKRAGAETLGLDILPETVELARENASRNGLTCAFQQGNAFEFLESADDRKWDWILLDPPAIAKAREKKDSLKWAIWKLAYNALPRLNPGGRLLVCSCSYQTALNDLMETVRLAANDRGVGLVAENITIQPPDHPVLLQFPESLYLRCLWLRALPGNLSMQRA